MEYVIWGIPPGEDDERVLHTKSTSRDMAEWVKSKLESEHGCRNVRIQIINPNECPSKLWKRVLA